MAKNDWLLLGAGIAAILALRPQEGAAQDGGQPEFAAEDEQPDFAAEDEQPEPSFLWEPTPLVPNANPVPTPQPTIIHPAGELDPAILPVPTPQPTAALVPTPIPKPIGDFTILPAVETTEEGEIFDNEMFF